MDIEATPAEWTAAELRNAVKAAGVALWTWIVEHDAFVMDAAAYELWDISRSGVLSFEDLSAKIHPVDRDRVRTAFAATRAIDGPFEIDFRILTDASLSDGCLLAARGTAETSKQRR